MQSPEDSGPAETSVAGRPGKRRTGKGRPPPPGDTLGALDPARNGNGDKQVNAKQKPVKALSRKRTQRLNFRVSSEFRSAFKRAAAARDCKKVELLERIFTDWCARDPAS
jgi:hypothetical protein